MTRTLGLVSGAGMLPVLVARQARQEGWRIVALALDDPGALVAVVDRTVACRMVDVGPILATLAEEEIRNVVLAGRVSKSLVFDGARFDDAGRALLAGSPDWTDDGLLRTATEALGRLGIQVLDQRGFLGPWLAPAGLLAGPEPTPPVRRDVEIGLAVARNLAAHGVGQTVVVRAGTVSALEAMEGTDETIRRGLGLAGAGAVVVKATGPNHDYRFDTPAVGLTTIMACAAGRAAALAIEAGRVLLVERELIAAEATSNGISLVGVGGDARTR